MKIPANSPTTSATVQGIAIKLPTLFNEDSLSGSADFFDSIGVSPAVAAAILQSVLVVENPRNNIAQAIRAEVYGPALISLGYSTTAPDGTVSANWEAAGSKTGNISDLDEDVRSELVQLIDTGKAQEIVDNYLLAYVPGQPRTRSASTGEVLDPVESKARELAKAAIAAKLATTSFTWGGTSFAGISIQARAASYKAANEKFLAEQSISLSDWLSSKIDETVESRPYFRDQARRMLAEAAAASAELDNGLF